MLALGGLYSYGFAGGCCSVPTALVRVLKHVWDLAHQQVSHTHDCQQPGNLVDENLIHGNLLRKRNKSQEPGQSSWCHGDARSW